MSPKTQYLLTGFTQEKDFRIFEFEFVDENRTRCRCAVRANLNLLRQYSIQVQELPLLCRRLLEDCPERPAGRLMTFEETSMQEHARLAKLEREELQRRRGNRKTPVPTPGAGWRLGQR